MIITAKPRISFLWIILATLPWVAVIFKDKVMGIAFMFSMRKFVENPAALTFLLTLPMYIGWVVPPVVNFIADRIWTRWGRRKPFVVVSWLGTISAITCMAVAPSFGWLLFFYMVFAVFNDLGGPVESLKMEIVPPAQRATSQAVLSWIAQVAVLVFWVVAIGRFDEVTTMFNIAISGEQGMYWAVSIGMCVMLLFLTLGIKETNPHSALRGQRFSFRTVFGGLFSKHLWPVYILAFSVAILGTGLGAFNQLLITEQWGYTKQDQGTNIAIGGIINLFLIPMLGLLANRVGRGNVYVGLVIAGIVVNFSMYMYYEHVLFDSRPTLIEMVVFGEMLSVIGILTGMALTPFVYDFIPRNELGTYAAGSGLVTKATGILTANLMGLFVWGWASMFLGPPGEMVRVTVNEPTSAAVVQQTLNAARWTDPQSGTPLASPKLTAQAYYATGANLDHGRGYEIRLRNDSSALLRDQRDRLDTQRGLYRARKGYAVTQWRTLTGEATFAASEASIGATAALPALGANPVQFGDAAVALATRESESRKVKTGDRKAVLEATIAAETVGERIMDQAVKQIEQALEARANQFRDQVVAVLGPKVLVDGNQVLAATVEPASIAQFELNGRPDSHEVEAALDRLHKADGNVIDLRVVPAGEKLQLALSLRAKPEEAAKTAPSLLTAEAGEKLKLNLPNMTPTVTAVEAIRLDLRIIEDPLDRHPSPITKAVNAIGSVVVEPPTPERRLNALGRGLRKPGTIDHASANIVPGDLNAVRITAIFAPVAATQPTTAPATLPAPEAVNTRLATLLDAGHVGQASTLYAAVVPVAKEQRMTIAKPVMAAGFAKQQYDYLAGYIAVFVLQLVGLGITFFFLYLVKTGRVRRRGAEEAEQIR